MLENENTVVVIMMIILIADNDFVGVACGVASFLDPATFECTDAAIMVGMVRVACVVFLP